MSYGWCNMPSLMSVQLTSEDRENIGRITTMITKFLSQDSELLRYEVKEEAISHRLGCYLRDIFEGTDEHYVVDCEYNKSGEGHGKIVDGKYIRPDILIHERGTQSHNLLVIEIKKQRAMRKWDRIKLRRLTSISLRAKYRYSLGLFIGFNQNSTRLSDQRRIWFKFGKELKAVQIRS